MATAQQPAATARVKRYNCLFSDQVNKKHRTYKDGYVRHHHFNNRLYLLSASQAELSTSFYSPVRPIKLPLSDTFELQEGSRLDFEGFVAEVGTIEFESTTNVSAIHARSKDPSQALKWANELADPDPATSPRPAGLSSTPRRPTPATAARPTSGVIAGLIPGLARSATATPSRQILVPPKQFYKGFGVPPPSTYAPGQKAPKPRPTRGAAAGSPPPAFPKALPDGGRPTTSDPSYKPVATPKPFGGAQRGVYGGTNKGLLPHFAPYARPPVATGTPARLTPDGRAPRPSGAGGGTSREELGVKELGGASTPTKGAVAAFRPPRPGGGMSGTPSRRGR